MRGLHEWCSCFKHGLTTLLRLFYLYAWSSAILFWLYLHGLLYFCWVHTACCVCEVLRTWFFVFSLLATPCMLVCPLLLCSPVYEVEPAGVCFGACTCLCTCPAPAMLVRERCPPPLACVASAHGGCHCHFHIHVHAYRSYDYTLVAPGKLCQTREVTPSARILYESDQGYLAPTPRCMPVPDLSSVTFLAFLAW